MVVWNKKENVCTVIYQQDGIRFNCYWWWKQSSGVWSLAREHNGKQKRTVDFETKAAVEFYITKRMKTWLEGA